MIHGDSRRLNGRTAHIAGYALPDFLRKWPRLDETERHLVGSATCPRLIAGAMVAGVTVVAGVGVFRDETVRDSTGAII